MLDRIRHAMGRDKRTNSLNLKSLQTKNDQSSPASRDRSDSSWENQANKYEDIDAKLKQKSETNFWNGKDQEGSSSKNAPPQKIEEKV